MTLRRSLVVLAFCTMLVAGSGCDKNPLSTLDPRGNPPVVSRFSVSPTTIRLDTLSNSGGVYSAKIVATASVADPDGKGNIAGVQASVIGPDGSTIQTIDLHDDGVAPDITGGDGTYSGQVVMSLSLGGVGTYQLLFTAFDTNQRLGTSALQSIIFYHRSSPPWLSNVSGPDSVQIPAADAGPEIIVFSVKAGDSSGIGDIKEVRLTVTGGAIPSTFVMADQNNIADKSTLDGELFADTLRVDNNSFARNYTILFQAIDRGGDTSATLSHSFVTYR